MSYGHLLLDLGCLLSLIWPVTLTGIKIKANKLERCRKFSVCHNIKNQISLKIKFLEIPLLHPNWQGHFLLDNCNSYIDP